jgi:tripartite-type tricarboxylate transporter receptor subunit TctC
MPHETSAPPGAWTRRHALVALAAASALPVRAQAWPTSPVRIVVPFAAGTAPDVVTRLYGHKLAQQLDATVLVENKAGGGSSIGAGHVAAAKPDGYTLLAGSNSALSVSPNILAKVPYDPEKDFRLIGPLCTVSQVLMAARDQPFASFDAFIEAARRSPGVLAYGSYGVGTTTHLMMEMMAEKAGVRLIHVPYKGGVEIGQALAGNQLPVGFESVPSAAPRARSGMVKPLALFADHRSTALPGVPTTTELGHGEANILGLIGLFASPRTPPAVVQRLEGAHAVVLRDAEYTAQLRAMGLDKADMTPDQFSLALRKESALVKQVVARLKIAPQ